MISFMTSFQPSPISSHVFFKTPFMEHLLGLPLRRPKCSRRRSGRKVFSRPCGGPKSMLWPPDVAQTPTFLTSNCGLTCSDRWSTCPQSLLSYPAVQVESIEKYDGRECERTYQTSLLTTSTAGHSGWDSKSLLALVQWSLLNSVESGFMFFCVW